MTPNQVISPARLAHYEKQPSALVNAKGAADIFGVGERKFHELRAAGLAPPAVVLGPRLLRWVRAELIAAAATLPRQKAGHTPEPAQLALGKAAKRQRATAQ